MKGSLAWHKHEEDELFLVLEGEMRIELQDRTIELRAGDLYIVPKGVLHNPVARDTCTVMLFEKKTTAHTGEVKADMTRDLSEQLRPL